MNNKRRYPNINEIEISRSEGNDYLSSAGLFCKKKNKHLFRIFRRTEIENERYYSLLTLGHTQLIFLRRVLFDINARLPFFGISSDLWQKEIQLTICLELVFFYYKTIDISFRAIVLERRHFP